VYRFRRDGYEVLRGGINPRPLSAEVDDAFLHGLRANVPINEGSGGAGFLGVIMMCEETPVSLELVDTLAVTAARLMGREALPGRAKATQYFGSTDWHVDSDVPIPSLGFVTYLEPLTADAGALRIRPGSHLGEVRDPVVIETTPGDVIAFDEHVAHSSAGGTLRRQWRVDFFADPLNTDEAAHAHAMFERILDPAWYLGDDSDGYPSYGSYWQTLDRPWHARLRDLGIYDLAARHRHAMRNRRRGTAP